jgi:5-(carboxyamino)imidazole ribonucleotide synthase
LNEKTLFRELGIPTPNFAAVNSVDDLKKATQEIGLPAGLKPRTMGYDGKGQAVIRTEGDIDTAWAAVGKAECILEGFVTFTREISIIAARGRNGEVSFYPVGENTHSSGILHHNVIVNGFDDPMQKVAEDYSRRLLDHFGYVGILSLELFDANGVLMANEIAPRVHNTGHWTIEGAETSQFENHIRAVMGLPLGDTSPVGCSAMVNFIGSIPPAESVLAIKGAHFHDYGKAAKPGRKIGHGTIRGEVKKDVLAGLDKLLTLV